MTLLLTVTDDDLSVSWLDRDTGLGLYRNGWNLPSTQFKGGGIYGNSSLSHGQILKHAVFDNVIDTFQLTLHFASINDLIDQIDELEELLLRRAPGYWLNGRYSNPVRLERQLDGETKVAYYLLSQGRIVKPASIVHPQTPEIQYIEPISAIINRQPFVYGAAPGTAQKRPEISAVQSWDYDRVWAEETTLPSGSIFSFAEDTNGDIYAGGASEILKYDGSWAAETTTPVTLAADVTSAILLSDGDFLFGESGRIIKLSSGTYSVETSLPSGQVWGLAETSDGQVYAADNGQILKRDTNGTWAADSTLPAGQVYTVMVGSNGRGYAGAAGEILRTVLPPPTSFTGQVSTGNDDAEQDDDGDMSLGSDDLDFFQADGTWIGLRFQNVTIPDTATITSAVVRLTAEDSDSGTAGEMNIYMQKAANPGTFTNSDDDISDRSRTTAFTTWTNPPSWVNNAAYDTPDITSAVQEVINQATWASGNAMVVIFELVDEDNDRDAHSYNGSASKAPQLLINYTVPSAGAWEVAHILASGGDARSSAESGGTLLFGESGQILASNDNGDTWGVADTTPTNDVRALHLCSGTTLYAADNGNILKSTDGGNSWGVDSTLPTTYGHALWCSADGAVRAGESGRILELSATTFETGQEATDTGSVMIANHHKESNLTEILNDDGGAFTAIYPASSFPVTLYPGTAALNDNVYFGTDTSLNDTGPFNSLIFDLSTGASAATSYTITIEYWNGAWVTLTAQDGTNQLSQIGLNAIVWEPPSDWATTSVNGVTGYWVRARLSALTGAFTNPIQQTRDIYSVNTPYIEMASTETLGNVDSLALIQVANRSEGSGGTPALATNRLLIGVKPYVNFESFRAFLNFADEQNPSGVTVDETVDGDSATSFVASLSAATGRAIFFDAGLATLSTMADRVTITLSTTIARAYYGTYRCFVRGKQTGGTAGEVTMRLKVITGSGGISYLTDTQATRSTTDHELIEFDDVINIPVSSQFTSSELGDETSITLQIATSAADADFYAYDLFLLPTDNFYVDALDAANTAASAAGNGERVTIDSISVPKVAVRAKAEVTATGLIQATYEVNSNGQFQVLNEAQQRLWMMTAQTQSAGTNIWHSKPEQVHSTRLWVTDRWLTGRGTV
jgi:hypothetical protein